MDDTPDGVENESSRSLLSRSAVATAGAGLLGIGSAAAQQDEPGDDEDDGIVEQDSGGQKGLLFQANFKPDAKFVITSDVIRYVPQVEEVTDNIWSDYDTRVIRYLNTGEHVLMFVAHEADVGRFDEDLGYVVDEDHEGDPQRPQVYDMDRNYTLIGDASYMLTVNFIPLREDNADTALAGEDWWRDDGE